MSRLGPLHAILGVAIVALATACTPFSTGDADAGSGGGDASGSPDSSGAPAEGGTDGASPGSCPADACSSCAGGICRIDCPGPKCASKVPCPAGVPCHVECTGVDACKTIAVDCTRATSCTVACNGGVDTCDELVIESGKAPLCMSCQGSKQACDAVTCGSSVPCSVACVGDACAAGKTCPECKPTAACP